MTSQEKIVHSEAIETSSSRTVEYTGNTQYGDRPWYAYPPDEIRQRAIAQQILLNVGFQDPSLPPSSDNLRSPLGDFIYHLNEKQLRTGKYDRDVLHVLVHPEHPLYERVIALYQLADTVYAGIAQQPLDQDRTGKFLQTLVALDEDGETPQELKEAMRYTFTAERLEQLAQDCMRGRWEMENAEAAAYVYTRFGTLEKIYGKEKAIEMKRKLAQKLIRARVFEELLHKNLMRADKNVIFLSAQGHELIQLAFMEGLQDSEQEQGNYIDVWPYYRSRFAVLGEEELGYMTEEQITAELYRKGELQGIDLPIFGVTFDKDGRIRIYRGLANVGGNIHPAGGAGHRHRMEGIQREGIRHRGPQRTKALRQIQLQQPVDGTVVIFGDGSRPHVFAGIDQAAALRSPTAYMLEYNKVAVGTETEDVTANTKLWEMGHGSRVPGVHVLPYDIEGMILSGRWTGLWLGNDTGPIMVDLDALRNAAHSTSHGHHLVAAMIKDSRVIL